ncbi:transcriptional regulator, partial [Streptomyces sp. MBT57]|nr:transcriptional regulator [Streptomyces sp. MBT57]
LCGRSGEEREALHHLWLRADAERVERQEAGMTGSPAAAVGEDAEAGAAPGTVTETGADAAVRRSRDTATGTQALSGSVPPAAAAVHRDEDSSAYAGGPPAHPPRSRSVRRW